MNAKPFEPIAIVGISAIFPGDGETEGFWRDIVAGRDLVREIPESYWLVDDYYDPDPKAVDKVYAKRGAFLSGIDFDAMGFGIPPQNLPETDSAQLLALVAAKRVLDQVGGGDFNKLDRSRTSVILGVTAAQKLAVEMNARIQRPLWAKAMREAGLPEKQLEAICDRISSNYVPWRENTFPGLLGNVIAGRIANRFNLGGTNCVTDAACASSFAAISMAIQELHLGHSDLAISGGVDTFNDPFMYMCFSKTPALSATGDCRPFSEQADGTILGEGIGMFALKRLSDAERDGNTIYSVIRGLGTSSDGRAKSVYAPLASGQAKALRRAYEAAGYSPGTVELVEAHGTGTVAGDQAEFEGLTIAFGEAGRADRQWCALGTVKSQIGHTKAAAGAAGLYKAAMALHHKILPPTIKVAAPNSKFNLPESPFFLNTRARPWIRGADHARRASVSSFGFGGSNFHLTLEEYGGDTTKIRTLSSELVLLSASDPAELLKLCEGAGLEIVGSLRALAQSSQRAFDPTAPLRLAVVAKNEADLREAMALAAERIRRQPNTDFSLPTGTYFSANRAETGKTAFIFPGQGSQYLEMGADLAMAWGEARAAWDEAAGFDWDPGKKLHHVVFPRPAWSDGEREQQKAELTATEWAQPAIGAASLSLLRLLDVLGLQADCVGGHSFGELSALFAAGALEAGPFLRAARKRGELMAEASSASLGTAGAAGSPGAMLAVVAPAEQLIQILKQGQIEDVILANRNSPRETVLAGPGESVERVEKQLAAHGLTCQRLKVATAFHSPLVGAAQAPFQEFLGTLAFEAPKIPVFSNATAGLYPTRAKEICRRLAEQIQNPVRFVEMIEAMYESGVRTFVEVGPSAVLTRLVGDILAERPHLAVPMDQRGREGTTSFWRALGKLAVAGVSLDFSALWMEYSRQAQPLSSAAAGTTLGIQISGSNYGKPKPTAFLKVEVPEKIKDNTREHSREHLQMREENQNQAPEILEPARDPGFMGAFAEIHRSTAEAHAAYQRAMAESHAAFLRASEETLTCLAAYLGGAPASVPGGTSFAPRARAPRQATLTPPAQTALSVQAPSFPAARTMPVAQNTIVAKPAILQPAPARPAPPKTIAAPAPRATETPIQAAPKQASVSADLKTTLFEVVAEKTGYPAEMLKPEMELEADLGIDSIKRVEILSALKKRVPSLAAATAVETAAMRSLGQIISFTEKKSSQLLSEPSLM